MTVDTVLFDLDGTLLDRRRTLRHHLHLQVRRHAALFDGDAAARYIATLLELDENHVWPLDDLYSAAERRCGLAAGTSHLLRDDFFAHFPETCIPFPGVIDTLATLTAAGLRLGLVTNGLTKIQTRKIDRLGIGPYFDCIVISEAAGFSKPDPRIFLHALATLGSEPARAAFVGDNPDVDVAGAKCAGLVAVWKRDPLWAEPDDVDLVIDEVAQLPQRLAVLLAGPPG